MGTCEGGHTQLLLQETPAPTVPVLHIPLLAQPWCRDSATAMLEPCLWLGVAHSGDLVAAALAQLLWSHVWLGHVSVCWVSWKLN